MIYIKNGSYFIHVNENIDIKIIDNLEVVVDKEIMNEILMIQNISKFEINIKRILKDKYSLTFNKRESRYDDVLKQYNYLRQKQKKYLI